MTVDHVIMATIVIGIDHRIEIETVTKTGTETGTLIVTKIATMIDCKPKRGTTHNVLLDEYHYLNLNH